MNIVRLNTGVGGLKPTRILVPSRSEKSGRDNVGIRAKVEIRMGHNSIRIKDKDMFRVKLKWGIRYNIMEHMIPFLSIVSHLGELLRGSLL